MSNYINDKVSDWIERNSTDNQMTTTWMIEISADYGNISVNEISSDDLTTVSCLIEKIKAFKPYYVHLKDIYGETDQKHDNNFPHGEKHNKQLGERTAKELYGDDAAMKIFCGIIPLRNYGIHHINKIEIYPKLVKIKLL